MIATYLKLSYRSMISKKYNSFISVLGLGIGIATAMLVGAYIVNENSFDKFHQNYNRLYRIVNKTSNTTKLDKEFAPVLVNDTPGVEKTCRMNMFTAMLGSEASPVNIDRLAIADSTFFQVFSFPLLIGSPVEVLNGPNKIVLSKSLAEKLFHNTSALGKQIRIDMKEYCTVTGIMQDSPGNSSIQPDAVVSLYTKDLSYTGGDYWNNNGHFHIELFQYYIILRNESDTLHTLEFLRNTYTEKWAKENPSLVLQPFSTIYSTTGIDEAGNFKHSNKNLFILLLSIGIIVLLLAIINTINILLSESLEETKLVCILKSTGAAKHNIVWQGLSTIFLTLILALGIALFLVDTILPWFSTEVDRQFSIKTFLSLPYVLFMLGTFIALIISIGLYPSIHFSKVNPIDLFRKSGFKNISFIGISRATLVFQFMVTIALLVSVITIVKQTRFVKQHQLGYKPDYLLFIPVHYTFSKQTLTIKQELLKNPSILQATASFGAPGNIYLISDNQVNEKKMRYWEINSDEDFFSTLGIKLKEGRFFLTGEKGRAYIVNEAFYKEAGFKDLTTATCRTIPIVGVVEDFNTESLHNEMQPGAIFLTDEDLVCLSLRISSENVDKTLDYIRKVWMSICPAITLNFSFYDDMIEQQYQQEKRLTATIGAASVIAIFISCLGLLSMILFAVKRRTKEIGIRKINGAKVSEVMLMLNNEFIKWVIISFVVTTPVIYYAMHKWLRHFAYKTDLSWWIFASAGLMALSIALLTVSWQSWRAATRNPVEALRYE
ncbi:MAG: ABC transporter permease [Bacteroidales bacterium]|nr:ABC transporter permease [Bacteroidales bacterium]